MTTRLILNADDFGLTPGVNRAIAELYDAGALSSTTLMANGLAFEHAVELARARPGLGVGCHVVLTDGLPVAAPSRIPSLLDCASPTPRLRPSLSAFVRAVLTDVVHEADIEREAEAQITRLLEAGIRPTHLDTHKHTHLFPAVLRPLLRVASRLGIPAIRNAFEPAWALRLAQGSALRRLQLRTLSYFKSGFQAAVAEAGLHTTDGTTGVSATGFLDGRTAADLLDALPPGTWEFVCHPGYNDADLDRVRTRLRIERDTERITLQELIPPALATRDAPHLVSFAALAQPPACS